ncbi:hypothetical protein BH09PLA1_BH09PLA1_02150 [soil metagenome]
MSVLNQLACALNRRDEVPNQQLAERIVKQREAKAIRELIEQLSAGKKAVRSDCIKVLYEIGARDPNLIAEYCDEFAALIEAKDNRLAWGAMTALDCIAKVRPAEVYKRLDRIVDAADKGSVITRDHAVGILIKLAADKSYAKKAIGLLLAMLKDAPNNQFPMYAENAWPVIGEADREAFRKMLLKRAVGLEKESQNKRVARVLRKLETKT